MCRMKTMLFKLPEEDKSHELNYGEQENLIPLCELNTGEHLGDIKTTEFNTVDANKCATVIDNHILFYDIGDKACTETLKITLEGKSNPKFTTGKWYPHQNSGLFIGISESNVLCYDPRIGDAKNLVWKIETNTTNHYHLRDFDCNVNVQGLIATAGDDGCIRLWDTRNASEPLYARRDHSHW